jgi:3-deoxy-7-phosphoheptulonate synthase
MIIVIKKGAPEEEITRISLELHENWQIKPETVVGRHHVIIGAIGDTAAIDPSVIQEISPWIERVLRVEKPFKRASREYYHGQASEVIVTTPNGDIAFGEHHPVAIIAGPCAVESEEMIVRTAKGVKAAGAKFLRGGAYKPRTSPYAFQGHGESALEMLWQARRVTGLGIVTEIMDTADIERVAEVADILQIGARNMQNFTLLKKVGVQPKPVLLKRGLAATIDDWLMAAEYILASGNPNVILCERGIRSFDRQYTRNILDLSAIPVLRSLTHLPIAIDPSHGTGVAAFVPTMAKASLIAGADALLIEVHPNPAQALSDGPQSLTLEEFDLLSREMAIVSRAVDGREQSVPVLV